MSTSSNPAPDPKTLLVVDDDPSVLTVVRCMLETGDYNVLLANSAELALRLVERDYLTIDLVLLDVVMPDLSGPELAERLLAIRPDLKVTRCNRKSAQYFNAPVRGGRGKWTFSLPVPSIVPIRWVPLVEHGWRATLGLRATHSNR